MIQRYGLVTDLDKLLLFGLKLNNDYIEEVNYKNIKKVLNDMREYIYKSNLVEDNTLEIFEYRDVINFIDNVCNSAINYIETDKIYFKNLRENLLSK